MSRHYACSSLLLSIQSPSYDKALDWLQFDYKGDQFGTYVDLDSTEFAFHTLAEGYPIFALNLQRLQNLYTRVYAWGSTYTLEPLRPEYKLEAQLESGKHLNLFPFGGDPSPN